MRTKTDPSMTSSSTVKFLAREGAPNPFQSLSRDAESRGFMAESRLRPQHELRADVLASLVTMCAIYFVKRVTDKIADKLGEDIYEWAKEKLPALWKTFYDQENRERTTPQFAFFKSDGIVGYLNDAYPDISFMFSIAARDRNGIVQLVFPRECERENFAKAIYRFFEAIQANSEDKPSPDTELLNRPRQSGFLVVTYDVNNDCLLEIKGRAD